MSYLYDSGRLSKKGGYWDTCDYEILRDQLMATFDQKNGQAAQSQTVSNWMTFESKPDVSSWWTAHNASANAANQRARASGLYAKESWLEQRFIDEAMGVINTIQSSGLENEYSPTSPITGNLARQFYPQQYNDESDALAFAKQGAFGPGYGVSVLLQAFASFANLDPGFM